MKRAIARPPHVESFPFFVHESRDVFISDRIRKTGVWEPFESRVLLFLLQNGDQVIDVGANIGWYTVSSARRVGESGHVFAFEPDAVNFGLLSANIRESGLSWVSAERSALGGATGMAVMHRSYNNMGDHRVRDFVANQRESTIADSIHVLSLDGYLAGTRFFDINKLRVIKIDVQGFEYEVLRGASDLLANIPSRTFLFIEFDPILLRDCDTGACNALVRTLASLHREIYALIRPIWRLKKLQIKNLEEAGRPSVNRSFDLILAHRDSVSDLRRAMPTVSRFLSALSI
jgi:FkbM family methyltransferase